MSKQTVARVACLSTLLGLSACGGGDGTSGICQALGGGNSTVNTRVVAGRTDDSNRVFDGDLSSFGTYTDATGMGSATYEGRSQAGTIAAAGRVAGIVVGAPPSTTTLSVTVSTTQDGVVQDTGSAGTLSGTSQTCAGACDDEGGRFFFFGINTTRAFNGINSTLQVNGQPVELKVYELCIR